MVRSRRAWRHWHVRMHTCTHRNTRCHWQCLPLPVPVSLTGSTASGTLYKVGPFLLSRLFTLWQYFGGRPFYYDRLTLIFLYISLDGPTGLGQFATIMGVRRYFSNFFTSLIEASRNHAGRSAEPAAAAAGPWGGRPRPQDPSAAGWANRKIYLTSA